MSFCSGTVQLGRVRTRGGGRMLSPRKVEAGPSLASPSPKRGGVAGLHLGDLGELNGLQTKLSAVPEIGCDGWSSDRADRAPFSPKLPPQQSVPGDSYHTLESFKQRCSKQDWRAVFDMKDEVKTFQCSALRRARARLPARAHAQTHMHIRGMARDLFPGFNASLRRWHG